MATPSSSHNRTRYMTSQGSPRRCSSSNQYQPLRICSRALAPSPSSLSPDRSTPLEVYRPCERPSASEEIERPQQSFRTRPSWSNHKQAIRARAWEEAWRRGIGGGYTRNYLLQSSSYMQSVLPAAADQYLPLVRTTQARLLLVFVATAHTAMNC